MNPVFSIMYKTVISTIPVLLSVAFFGSLVSCTTIEQVPFVESGVESGAESGVESNLPAVNFSGNWEINHELTESPGDKIRWLYDVAKSQIEQQQRRHNQNQRGLGGPSLRNISAINDLQAVIGLGTLAESISRADVLVIEQGDDAIVVKREGDYALSCDFTRAEIRVNSLGNEYCHFSKNGQVVFLVALPEGLTLVNRMVLSKDGQHLNVATTLKSSDLDQEFTLNRVYMRFEAGKDMYDCKFTLKDKKTCWLGQ